ncbi:hypothetical protein C1H46_029851 [Malus baccata]|uniref:Sec16 Sec23-binding domain-containing protein n=1 Tax=Malus baccata TaxID=106549 RepID=A0A540LDN2_MALBA|nr:hypothetical protein C1H46_029851 [Malus baccata]
MASSPFEVEDTDEDFFDRLVNDDIDFTEFVHKPVQKKEFVDVKAFSKLSISEVDPVGVDTSGNASLGVNGELGHEDGVVVEQSDPVRDPVVVKESESLIVDSRNKVSASDDIVDNRNGASAPDDIDDNRNEPTELEDKAGNGNEAKSLEDKAGNENEANELEDKGEEGSFYGDTVKLMSLNQLAAGSPLRTLCLLIARQPADVFSSATTDSSIPNSMNVSQQQTQVGANSMLDEWEENLAILTANRTKDDELVIIHLGDCLWKERGHVYVVCFLDSVPSYIYMLETYYLIWFYHDKKHLCRTLLHTYVIWLQKPILRHIQTVQDCVLLVQIT